MSIASMELLKGSKKSAVLGSKVAEGSGEPDAAPISQDEESVVVEVNVNKLTAKELDQLVDTAEPAIRELVALQKSVLNLTLQGT